MRQAPEVSWQVLLDEDAWEQAMDESSPVAPSPAGHRARSRRTRLLTLLLPLLLLALIALVGVGNPYAQAEATAQAESEAASQRQTSLTSEFFVFHFSHLDQPAVSAAAPRLDRAFVAMRRNLGLASPGTGGERPARIVVHLLSEGERPLLLSAPGEPLLLPSPRRLSEQEGNSQTDLLLHSVLPALAEWTLAEALAEAGQNARGWKLSPALRSGLRLWMQWESSGTPTAERRRFVRQAYGIEPAAEFAGQPLCRADVLWQIAPNSSSLLLHCNPRDGSSRLGSGPVTALGQIVPALAVDRPSYANLESFQAALAARSWQASIGSATLLEYASQRYGPGRIPLLLHALTAEGKWQQAIPSVFGVSAEAFEAGWRAWRGEVYGLPVCGPSLHHLPQKCADALNRIAPPLAQITEIGGGQGSQQQVGQHFHIQPGVDLPPGLGAP